MARSPDRATTVAGGSISVFRQSIAHSQSSLYWALNRIASAFLCALCGGKPISYPSPWKIFPPARKSCNKMPFSGRCKVERASVPRASTMATRALAVISPASAAVQDSSRRHDYRCRVAGAFHQPAGRRRLRDPCTAARADGPGRLPAYPAQRSRRGRLLPGHLSRAGAQGGLHSAARRGG